MTTVTANTIYRPNGASAPCRLNAPPLIWRGFFLSLPCASPQLPSAAVSRPSRRGGRGDSPCDRRLKGVEMPKVPSAPKGRGRAGTAAKIYDKADLAPDQQWRKGLTLQEQAFVSEYLVDFNATRAAMRSGITQSENRTACSVLAARVLNRPHVREAIGALFDMKGVSAQRLVEEYANIAFANATDYVEIKDGKVIVNDTSEWSPEQKRAVTEISETITKYGTAINVKFADKLGALNALAKARGMFSEKVDVNVSGRVEHELTRESVQATIEGLFARLSERQQEPEFKVIEALPAPDTEVKE